MTPTRILILFTALLLAVAPAARAAEPPPAKPCCCCDDKPCATTCPPTAATPAAPCCCETNACCATSKCCEAKAACECKDCCCAKGCSCGKGQGVAKAAPGCCPMITSTVEPTPPAFCRPPRPLRGMVVPPVPPAAPLPPPAYSVPLMPIADPLPLAYPVPPPGFVPPGLPVPECFAVDPTPSKWCVKATTSRGLSGLEISQDEDCKVACEKFVLTVGEESFEVAVREKQVSINSSFLKGTADRITRTRNTDQIVLEGNVKVAYSKDGQKADLSGGVVVVDLVEGSVQVKPAQSDEVQMFQFFMGFFN
jgi:hypothetical protein